MARLFSLLLFAVFAAALRDLNTLEAAGLLLAVAISLAFPRLAVRPFKRVETAARWLARRPTLAMIGVGAAVIIVRLMLLPWFAVPFPIITDEYSHLLLADTLAHGRLTNPPHPMWQHFETMHVIFQPTYNSMYLPGQALFLAAGKLIVGSAWAGVLLSTGLMTSAIFWMLCAWFPNRWALLGAVLAGLRWGIHSYWVNSYWGGAMPAFAGALAMGASMRLYKQPRARHALVLGLGCFLLAISRPFEGFVVILPCSVLLLAGFIRSPSAVRSLILRRTMLPVATVGLLSCSWIAYYCWRVTGGPFRLPYQINQEMYGWPMTLPFFQSMPVSHRHAAMADYYRWESEEHQKLADPLKHADRNLLDIVTLWSFYAGPILSVFLLFAIRGGACRRVGLLFCVFLLALGVARIEQSRYPHYIAPAAAAAVGLTVYGIRVFIARNSRSRAWRVAMVRWSLVWLGVVVLARSSVLADLAARSGRSGYISWCCSREGNKLRTEAAEELSKIPGKHLVIVRYGPTHHWMNEWVHNDADIDASKIVWARDLGAAGNLELIRYFHDRTVWLATPEEAPVLRSYFERPPQAVAAER